MSAVVRLAVLGDPLAYTLSPVLHRAGCEAAGRACESRALRTPPDALAARLAELEAAGLAGCNLTHPLKEPALALVASASEAARRARSVNTIAFGPAGRRGETTDGAGFADLLGALGRDAAAERVLLLGAGGAARSVALGLRDAGCADVTVSSRTRPADVAAWGGARGASWVAWRSGEEADVLASATLVVNCTPLANDAMPLPPGLLPPRAMAIDLTYGPELGGWVRAARAAGREAHDGLGLLVHQARRSLSLWLGCDVPLAPLAAAVGWPR